tara:strand:- start:904 stop:1185 length:282 start_codon:yes stop_codon:yes gene_type:complete
MKLYQISIHGAKVPKHIKEKMIIEAEKILRSRFGNGIYSNFDGKRLPIGLVRLPEPVENIDLTKTFAITVSAKLTQLNGNHAETMTKGGHNGK